VHHVFPWRGSRKGIPFTMISLYAKCGMPDSWVDSQSFGYMVKMSEFQVGSYVCVASESIRHTGLGM
jgi:hypothetical protein